jgi:hypothetical protein
VQTVNGRIRLRRTRWYCPKEGSSTPMDQVVDAAEATISQGVRELACRLNQHAECFQKAAKNLGQAAQVYVSKELLRQVVEAEGKAVLRAQKQGSMPPSWAADDCRTEEGPTRVYVGCDGVKVPLVTDAEKHKRRQNIRAKRRRWGRKAKPLPRAKAGADNVYKEFRVVTFYDETQQHCQVAATRGNHEAAGRLLQREATRLRLRQAQEKVANVDGAPWIRNQLELYGLVDAIGLDFYHLSENVEKARRGVSGEEPPEGKQWAAELMHCFQHGATRPPGNV